METLIIEVHADVLLMISNKYECTIPSIEYWSM